MAGEETLPPTAPVKRLPLYIRYFYIILLPAAALLILNQLHYGYNVITISAPPVTQQAAQPECQVGGKPVTDYVDPFIGTGDQGHTYPGATVPFGAVQLSPDNPDQGWEWCSGYHQKSTAIVGFSHTHLSGTGMHDLMDVSIFPTVQQVDIEKAAQEPRNVQATFSHDKEHAEPGYYRVLLDNGINAELTATKHTGMHRYRFPRLDDDNKYPNASTGIILNLGNYILHDRTRDAHIEILSNSTISGYRISDGWARDQRVYFMMEFSEPFVEYSLAGDSIDDASAKGRQVAAYLKFDCVSKRKLGKVCEVMVKTGISTASIAGAEAGLQRDNPLGDWDFERIRGDALAAWEAELCKIKVESTNEDNLKTFYTALYHSKLAPMLHSDALGEYKGTDQEIRKVDGYKYYSTLSLWDTFRAAQSLLLILNPDVARDMMLTMLAHADATHGTLPIWALAGTETNTMPGYHAAVVLAEGVFKGLLRDFELNRTLAAMKTSSLNPERGGTLMEQFGYVPFDRKSESVTVSLELGYDDWCVAMVADLLGEKETAAHYYNRSLAYTRVFDPSTGFMRAKSVQGTWKEPFDPYHSQHGSGDYTEGTAWQHLWFVPHDIPGLIQLLNGTKKFEEKLDALFTADTNVNGSQASMDIMGLIGQYAHGNEPSHHVAYLYNAAGVPHKTQARVKEILTTLYAPTPEGLSGNEDCGQMSAWYVLSALGFFPVNPADVKYELGSPLFDKVVISLDNGNAFEIRAKGAESKGAIYVKKARLNGKRLNRTYIVHEEIMAGGILEMEMSTRIPTPLV